MHFQYSHTSEIHTQSAALDMCTGAWLHGSFFFLATLLLLRPFT